MKAAIIPILIVLVSILGLGWQRSQINALREQTEELSRHFDRPARRSNHPAKNRLSRSSPLDTRPINWLLVAEEFQSGTITFGFYRSTFGLDEQLRRLSDQELKKGLNDIKTENWDPDRRPYQGCAKLTSDFVDDVPKPVPDLARLSGTLRGGSDPQCKSNQ